MAETAPEDTTQAAEQPTADGEEKPLFPMSK